MKNMVDTVCSIIASCFWVWMVLHFAAEMSK